MSASQPLVVFLVQQASDEQLLRLGLWVVTAASVGERVDVLLCAPALERLLEGAFDNSTPAAARLGLPTLAALLEQARALGPMRLLTCDTEIALAGLSRDVVSARVDEVVSLPSFWRSTQGARTVVL